MKFRVKKIDANRVHARKYLLVFLTAAPDLYHKLLRVVCSS